MAAAAIPMVSASGHSTAATTTAQIAAILTVAFGQLMA